MEKEENLMSAHLCSLVGSDSSVPEHCCIALVFSSQAGVAEWGTLLITHQLLLSQMQTILFVLQHAKLAFVQSITKQVRQKIAGKALKLEQCFVTTKFTHLAMPKDTKANEPQGSPLFWGESCAALVVTPAHQIFMWQCEQQDYINQGCAHLRLHRDLQGMYLGIYGITTPGFVQHLILNSPFTEDKPKKCCVFGKVFYSTMRI